jgi:hypothetical protein
MGVFTVDTVLDAPGGRMTGEHRFLRLPKLEHPRLLYRKEEIREIRARIAKFPLLYKRYADWLHRQCGKEGFLPATMTPTYMSNEYHNVTSRWRVVACEFAALFLDPQSRRYFSLKAAPLFKKRDNLYETYHQSRFGGALACLFDMACSARRGGSRTGPGIHEIQEYFGESLGVSEFLAESLLALEEPLTPRTRAILNQQMMWLANVEQYFGAHAGRRGGNWWLTTRTGCSCPLNSFGESFLFFRNAFGMKRLLEENFVGGTYTHLEYVKPLYDVKRFYLGGFSGSQIQWAVSALSRQPVEKYRNGFDQWIAEMNSPMPEAEEKSVDKLMAQPQGLVLPLFLAFGWYEPSAPEVAWEELPPSALFDVEGEAAALSDWRDDSTWVYFGCGVRDVAYHNQPSHFEVMKAGQVLMGSGSLLPEDGSPAPAWGNVVVVGDDWPLRWKANVGHPRMGEFPVMDRFSPATLYYTVRDYALSGFRPPYNLPGKLLYGSKAFYQAGLVLGLHGHSQHPFIKEGEVVAYETWPEFDYVAGDVTNAWPVDRVVELYRQLVFIRDNVVVIYDRGILGPKGSRHCWLAAIAPTFSIEGNRFEIRNEQAALRGQVLLPADAELRAEDSVDSPTYSPFFFKGQKIRQKVLEVRGGSSGASALEFLTVMNVGVGEVEPPSAEITEPADRDHIGIEFSLEGRQVSISFRRQGPVGGHIKITGGPRVIDKDLVQSIDDSYHQWANDPRYQKWITDPRFRFIVPTPVAQ